MRGYAIDPSRPTVRAGRNHDSATGFHPCWSSVDVVMCAREPAVCGRRRAQSQQSYGDRSGTSHLHGLLHCKRLDVHAEQMPPTLADGLGQEDP